MASPQRISDRPHQAHLPPELIDAIFVQFRTEKKTLAACSLVCRAWLPCARRYQFATMSLRFTALQPSHFPELLRSSIIAHVCQLGVVGDLGHECLDKYLPQLTGFTHVKGLHLSCVPWYLLATKTQLAFFNNFANITWLSIRRSFFYTVTFATFAEFICAFPSLEKIHIQGSWGGPFPLSRPTLCLPCNLWSLELECNPEDVLTWLLSFEKMPALRTVCLRNIWKAHATLIGRFLRALGSSLESFWWLTVDNSGMSVFQFQILLLKPLS